ncbi:MAG: ATP-dependent sacrificial sulfur transferase LarE [Planctomycetota bacterium]|nr:ATP-dependent sacrificial sulfur transferase LarE [Planctomycetota bacterium]
MNPIDTRASEVEMASRLTDRIAGYGKCIVAFSGGVDSSVVAMAAVEAVGKENCVAITAESPSVSQFELETAAQVARKIGIRHRLIQTSELENRDYVANRGNRCFFCKSELYSRIVSLEEFRTGYTLLNGTNADDLGDYRPGLQAASDHNVVSPLAELGYDKSTVRVLARLWDLPIWNKPASPCLASRIAHGEPVTPEKLAMIEKAEGFLREKGFHEFRVRYHAGHHARIEFHPDELEKALNSAIRSDINSRLKTIGFQFVAIDLEGFRPGKLNEALPVHRISSHSH